MSIALGITGLGIGGGPRLDSLSQSIIAAYSGALFVPSTSTCFSDSAGTTPAVKDGVVGCIVDSATPVGANVVVNGGFDDSSAWTLGTGWSISGGKATHTGTTVGNLQQNVLTAGVTYHITMSFSGTGTAYVYAGGSSYAGNLSGNVSLYLTASNSQILIQTASDGLSVDNVSYVPVGPIATQATTGYKPILRKGAKNLLTYSEDFSNAIWVNVNSTDTSGQSDRHGGSTATKITNDATLAKHTIYYNNAEAIPENITSVLSVYAKAGTSNYLMVIANNVGAGRGAIFNLATGTIDTDNVVDTGGTGTVTSAYGSITSVGNGWYRCSITVSCTGAQNSVVGVAQSGTLSYSGGGEYIYIDEAQLEIGSTASTYVATTSAPASNGEGSWWLDFDGIDDRLQLSAVPFQMSDAHFVSSGGKNLKSSGAGTIFTVYGAGSQNSPRLYNDTGVIKATWTDDAATTDTLLNGASTLGTNTVSSARKNGTAQDLRINGVQVDTGTNTFSTTTLTAAMISGNANFMSGSIYGLVFGKGAITDAELLTIERYLGNLAGVTI